MNVYWKSAVNQMMSEEAFNVSLSEVKSNLLSWAQTELSLSGCLCDEFVNQKLEEYKRSFMKIEMPFETEEQCSDYLNEFYSEYQEIIQLFPYDRWAWAQKLDSIHYGDYDIRCVNVLNQILDCKEVTH